MSTTQRPSRSRLKTLLALATLVCLVLGWRIRAYLVHRDAVESLVRQGVELRYAGEEDGPATSLVGRLTKAVGPHPIWRTPNEVVLADADLPLDALSGLAQLHGVKSIVYRGKYADTQVLALLGSRDDLRKVRFGGDELDRSDNSGGLELLREASQLEMLWLDHVTLPEAGLSFLRGCPDLRVLSLTGMPLGDEELSAIANCYRLQELSLRGGRFTREGLEQLTRLPKLARLGLDDAEISEGGYEVVGRLHPLEFLSLAGTNVGDADLIHVFDLHHLKALDLSRTAITDEGLKYLKVLSSLESIDLDETPTSDEAIDELDAALPNWDRGE